MRAAASIALPTYYARLCARVESTWPAVGRVDRRGQYKRSICEARGPYHMIRSTMKPVFSTSSTDLFYLRVAQMPRCTDLVIFVLTTDR
jgi:hypothetical protein